MMLEAASEFLLGDVGDEAEVRSGDAEGAVEVEGGEIAVVPGTAQEGREVSVAALDVVEDGGEFLGEGEEAALSGRALIAEGLEEAVGGEAGPVDTGGEPEWVNSFEKVGDEVPTGAFAGFAGVADEDDKEVEGVAGGLNHAVGAGTDEVAEGGQELEEDRSWVGFGVGGQEAHDAAGYSVEGCFVELRAGLGWLGSEVVVRLVLLALLVLGGF